MQSTSRLCADGGVSITLLRNEIAKLWRKTGACILSYSPIMSNHMQYSRDSLFKNGALLPHESHHSKQIKSHYKKVKSQTIQPKVGEIQQFQWNPRDKFKQKQTETSEMFLFGSGESSRWSSLQSWVELFAHLDGDASSLEEWGPGTAASQAATASAMACPGAMLRCMFF